MSNGEICRLDNNALLSVLSAVATQSLHLFLHSPLLAWFYSSVKVYNNGKRNRCSPMFKVSKAMLSIITAQASSITLTL